MKMHSRIRNGDNLSLLVDRFSNIRLEKQFGGSLFDSESQRGNSSIFNMCYNFSTIGKLFWEVTH